MLQSQGEGFNKTKNPMIIGILDQSLATWCGSALGILVVSAQAWLCEQCVLVTVLEWMALSCSS